MKKFCLLFVINLCFSLFGFTESELPQFKSAPTRPSEEAEIVVEWQEVLNECFEGKICVQGQLYNRGKKTAKNVKLRIEIGGTKHTKPRIILTERVEQPEMNPGDRQDFDLTIARRVTFQEKGQDKAIEVGKYNFKVVPFWANPSDKKTISTKKSKPINK